MRLGVIGGTFDPIHYAHLFIAQQAQAACALDRVLFVPNRIPAHKQAVVTASAEDRFEMVRLAVADNTAFECSRIEMDRSGPSYTVDTLLALRQLHPDAELFFITGTDTVMEMPTWYRPDEILRLCRIVTAERPGCTLADLRANLSAAYADRVIMLPPLCQTISATDIRQQVSQNLPIRYLTPDAVAQYIADRGLYRAAPDRRGEQTA